MISDDILNVWGITLDDCLSAKKEAEGKDDEYERPSRYLGEASKAYNVQDLKIRLETLAAAYHDLYPHALHKRFTCPACQMLYPEMLDEVYRNCDAKDLKVGNILHHSITFFDHATNTLKLAWFDSPVVAISHSEDCTIYDIRVAVGHMRKIRRYQYLSYQVVSIVKDYGLLVHKHE